VPSCPALLADLTPTLLAMLAAARCDLEPET
jgi:hypothetical protein